MVSKEEFVETLRSNEIAKGKEQQHFDAFCEDFGADGESHVNFRDYCIGLVWRCASDEDAKMRCKRRKTPKRSAPKPCACVLSPARVGVVQSCSRHSTSTPTG